MEKLFMQVKGLVGYSFKIKGKDMIEKREENINNASAFLKTEEFNKALQFFQKAKLDEVDSKRDPIVYTELDEYSTAMEIYKKAIETNINENAFYDELEKLYHHLGNFYMERGEDLKVIAFYEKMLTFMKPNFFAYSALGYAYAETKEYLKDIEFYNKANEFKPAGEEYEYFYDEIGLAYQELKEYEKAIEAYKKAIELDPYEYYYFHLGNVYALLGEYDEMKKAYLKAIELDSDTYGYLYEKIN